MKKREKKRKGLNIKKDIQPREKILKDIPFSSKWQRKMRHSHSLNCLKLQNLYFFTNKNY